VFSEQAYEGPYAGNGADLLLTMDGYRYIAFPMFASDTSLVAPQVRGDSGCHRLPGIMMASGPAVRQGAQVEGAQISDLAPTILYRMGLPVPDNMDGQVLTDLFSPEFVDANPVRRTASETSRHLPEQEWRPEEAAEIEDRLRGLGYLG
jgi:hypothetical protein